MKKVIVLSLVTLIFGACYTSKKALRPVNIAVNKNFEIVLDKDPKGHFMDYYTADQYRATYLEGLKKALELKNIFIVEDKPEFIVTIDKLVLTESLTTDTVKDSKSTDFGKVYDITKLSVIATGTVTSTSDSKKSEFFKAERADKEKLTNFFPIGATINGRKPGPNDWRKKPFDSHEFSQNVNTVGSRTGDVVTNRVNKFIK